jgi:hypothetical protein
VIGSALSYQSPKISLSGGLASSLLMPKQFSGGRPVEARHDSSPADLHGLLI